MRALSGKYEAEIRLALVLIVGLLLILNIATTYMLYHVDRQLTGNLDHRLASAQSLISRYLKKDATVGLDRIRQEYIRQQAGITSFDVIQINDIDADSVSASIDTYFAENREFPGLDESSVKQLLDGRQLYRFGRSKETRFSLALTEATPGRPSIIVAQTDAAIVGKIGTAAGTALYMAAGILLLIAALMIILPRYILRPFKVLRDQARSAGRLMQSDSSDEVADVIKTYENIIEELKKSEAELERLYRESSIRADRLERLNEYILKSIGSGVVNVDLAGKIIGFNRAAGDILGLDESEIIGKHYLVGLPGEMELNLMIGAGLERGDVTGPREIIVEHSDGDRRWLGVESSIIYDDRDSVVGVTLVITDMTELKRLQSELEAGRQMAALGEMTGGLAHQLRNSMAAISGFCQLLQKKAAHEPSLSEIAASIRSEAATSEHMVSRFLNFARPLTLSEDVIHLGELIKECRQKWDIDAARKGVEVTTTDRSGDIEITGDIMLLKEAIGNVIDNAIQVAGHGGQVRIILEQAATQAEILISDTGPGIPEHLREKLFTPFVSSKPSGTGLGLALTRKIIHLHKGSISFDSAPEGGTTCRIVLPVSKLPDAEKGLPVGGTGKNQ